MCAELLPPLSPGRAARAADRFVNKSHRIPMCHSSRDRQICNSRGGEESNVEKHSVNRRNTLMGGNTLACHFLACPYHVRLA
jgi:hypothetical protein